MRPLWLALAGLSLCFLPAWAQSHDCASFARSDDGVTLTATSWDPVRDIAATLADRYGIRLSVESPQWAYPVDTEDVAVADPEFSAQHHNIHYLLMKRHTLQIHFSLGKRDVPEDIVGVLRQLAMAANAEMPYGYRLDVSGDDYIMVPTKALNAFGEVVDVTPLLDRQVTISAASRPIAEQANIMAAALREQTGLHISCCEMMATGVIWGTAEVAFEANDKPAREVLRSLMRLEQEANWSSGARHPDYDRWTVDCDGTGAPWCFINLQGGRTQGCR